MLSSPSLTSDGYTIIPGVLESERIEALRQAIAPLLAPTAHRGGVRNVLQEPALRAAATGPLLALARQQLGPNAFAVRALVFDKTPLANWKVTWHQDVTIAVTEYHEQEGWGPWSRKAGTWHVRPPGPVLEGILTVRLHLDDCRTDNGPVRVIPGSHLTGRLSDADVVSTARAGTPIDCLVPAGGVLLMRPLLLHASAPAAAPLHRRVLHVEYSASPLPDGFTWAEQVDDAA